MLIKPWHIIVATVTASVVAVTGVGAVGLDEFRSSQTEAIELAQESLSDAQERIDEAAARIADLELAISNAEDILDGSERKTLDEQAREDLDKEIAAAQKILKQEKEQLFSLKQTVRTLASLDINGFFWPGNVKDTATAVSLAEGADTTKIITKVSGIGDRIKAVQSAQAAWQAEQDRVAAEKAAAEAAAQKAVAEQAAAAARRAASSQTIKQSGGSTAPTAPTPPAFAQAAISGFDAVAYIRALAPNAEVVWQNDVCKTVLGYEVWLCGFALIDPNGNSQSSPVYIYLDGLFTDRYSTDVGLSVLVHEAAHARQFWNYGPAMLPNPTSAPAGTGKFPIEWMADCATIAKLGYGTGAYVRPWERCTDAQLAEAGSIW